ncbi:MAG: LPS assembly lipoprotein LptE [Acidobacteriota bacterium]|nr:LPS assembly lipoprotein LptE [Acidobacteriota bacterium]
MMTDGTATRTKGPESSGRHRRNLLRLVTGFQASVLLLSTLSLAGCGYALVGRSSSLPEDIRNIYVQTLGNQTTRTQVDQILSQAIASEFVKRQRFRVVSTSGEADAILSGTVTLFRVRPVAFGAQGRAREYEVYIGGQMEFRRAGDEDEILWKQTNYQFRETYEADISEIEFFSREDQAIEEVADKFAESIVIDILEGF